MKMPSKVPADIELDDDAEIEMPEGPALMPQRKEYLWGTDLKGKDAQIKFEGGDAEDETLIFKSAALGAGAKGDHVVELSAVDVKSEKVTVTLCILNSTNRWIRLPSISVEPPILLKLTEGEGPVNICANHCVSEEWDEEDESMDDEDEAAQDDRTAEEVKEESPKKAVAEESPKKEAKKETAKRKAEESPEKPTTEKKAKAERPKKTPRTYDTVDDLKKAILANPGGKPKKEDKFKNWVKNTMKCSKEEWYPEVWEWHQEQFKAKEVAK